MYVGVYVRVGMLARQNENPWLQYLKLDIVAVFDTVSKPSDLGFKRSRVGVTVRELVPPENAWLLVLC